MSSRVDSEPPRGVLHLRVTLEETEPPVWRELDVPESFDFWALHCAIQDAMGWQDCHLHVFRARAVGAPGMVRIGLPDDDDFGLGPPRQPGWEVPIAPFFARRGSKVQYVYDFGDDWSHAVELRERRSAQPRERLPRVLAGARACPPEDCGGPHGYAEFLDAIRDPQHEEHAALLEWVGGSFDPKDFDPTSVRFRNPERYRKKLFGPGRRKPRGTKRESGGSQG
jgi:hypothetical protein